MGWQHRRDGGQREKHARTRDARTFEREVRDDRSASPPAKQAPRPPRVNDVERHRASERARRRTRFESERGGHGACIASGCGSATSKDIVRRLGARGRRGLRDSCYGDERTSMREPRRETSVRRPRGGRATARIFCPARTSSQQRCAFKIPTLYETKDVSSAFYMLERHRERRRRTRQRKTHAPQESTARVRLPSAWRQAEGLSLIHI